MILSSSCFSFLVARRRTEQSTSVFYKKSPKILSDDESEEAILPLMNIASAHFISQALNGFVEFGIADIIGDATVSIEEIAEQIGTSTNLDALLRTMRLLASVGIVESHTNDGEILFCLTNTGALLQKNSCPQKSLASCVSHWMEQPLWNSWLHLPEYIKGENMNEGKNVDPFTRANGQSSDSFYNAMDRPQSLQYANDFVRFISDGEIDSIVRGLDWSIFNGKTILDIGGYNGKVMERIARGYPEITCKCLDLPDIIASVKVPPSNVQLIGGDVFDMTSIPSCDVIILKHFLDRCMWDESETQQILETCFRVLPKDGHVILGEAVIPDPGDERDDNRLQLSLDALYMLVGRERQRTESEWRNIAQLAGFHIAEIIYTKSPSCSLIILQKQ